jgi:osmotically-inducible protein OsmY
VPISKRDAADQEAVLSEVRLRFERSPYQELHGVICDFQKGVLSLRGRVPSCFLKQIAQSTVFSIERVEMIDNRLEVVDC